MKHSFLAIGIIIGITFSLIGCSFQGMATLYPYHVDSPNASFGIADWGGGSRYTSNGANNISDGATLLAYAPVNEMWVATGGNFTINPWTYPALPNMPNNASIIYVAIIVVFKHMTNETGSFQMQYTTDSTYEEIWDNEATWHSAIPANGSIEYYVPYWKTVERNITDSSVGGPDGGWTPAMILSPLTWVRMFVQMHTYYSNAFLVDYVGLKYIWQYEYFEGWEDEDGEILSSIGIDLPGTLGLIGFVGMIGVPAGGIVLARRDGGSKVMAFLGTLTAFLVCVSLFLGSLA